MDRAEQEWGLNRSVMAFRAGGGSSLFLGMTGILRMAVCAYFHVILRPQVDLAVAFNAVCCQCGQKSFGRFNLPMALEAGRRKAGGIHRRLRVVYFTYVMRGMAGLAFGRPFHITLQNHAMGCFLIRLHSLRMARGTPHFRKPFCRMEVRLCFLMAVCTAHPGSAMYRGGEGLFVHVKREERSVFFPFAEQWVLVAFQALGVLCRRRGGRPEKEEYKKREPQPSAYEPQWALPFEHVIRVPFFRSPGKNHQIIFHRGDRRERRD